MKQILPKHIGIMIDGNRRWAREKKLPVFFGHKRGTERVIEIVDYAAEKGIKTLTLYGFSTENWKRSKKEVDYLMDLFVKFAKEYAYDFNKKGIQFRHIGELEMLPKDLQKNIKEAQKLTKNNKKMVLNIALNYGGRNEIVRAIRKIIQKKISPEKINEKVVMNYLDTKGLPDVDFIIRTSGEMRLSNFLPFQGTYAELYFPKICWPDFTKKQFDLAIKEFQKRRRRFGK